MALRAVPCPHLPRPASISLLLIQANINLLPSAPCAEPPNLQVLSPKFFRKVVACDSIADLHAYCDPQQVILPDFVAQYEAEMGASLLNQVPSINSLFSW